LTAAEPTFEPGVWIGLQHDAVQDISYDGILRCYEEGCQMLGEYPSQLVSVHDPDEYLAAATDAADRRRRLDDLVQAYRALTELRNAGKVAGVGVGAKDWRSIQELDQECDFDWVMMANSFTIMNHPAELVQFVDSLAARNIALVNSALTHGGFLVGGKFFDYRELDPHDPRDAERLNWRESFTAVCDRHGVTPYDVAVAFGHSHPGVTSIALSTSRVDRVEQMVKTAEVEIADEVWKSLREAGLISPAYPHLR
jgi:D-threo-aldose 1-dehydrogenase